MRRTHTLASPVHPDARKDARVTIGHNNEADAERRIFLAIAGHAPPFTASIIPDL